MENSNDIRSRLEEIGLKPGQIDEVLPLLMMKTASEEAPSSSVIQDLKDQMAGEQDYNKRAALAARIISLSLDSEY